MAIFRFPKWRPTAILDFVVAKMTSGALRAVHGHQHTKFGEDISNSGWVMDIFIFSKWRPAAILDYATGQKRRHGTLRTVHVYNRTKFGDSISNGVQVIATLRFSKCRPPPSWILLDFIFRPPRSLPDDLKLCLKFYVDPIYTFEDIAISIFGNLA